MIITNLPKTWYNFDMKNIKQKVKTIIAKDENKAVEAVVEMINSSDVNVFEELVKQSDFLFPFIKDNVCKRFEKSLRASNYKNLLNFLNVYSQDYDRVFASAFKVFGNEEIKPVMLDLLKNGSTAQKTYATRFYELSPDLLAVKELIQNAFDEDENLADASASALGVLNEQKSYLIALEKLNSDDDFETLKGLNFFVSYIKNPPMKKIFEVLKKSGMPENFAGKIAYLTPLPTLIKEDLENALTVIDNILVGFGEILPLSQVFDFELYDVFGMLSELCNGDLKSRVATVLLRAKSKFATICGSDEYTFDEDKNTKDELITVEGLLNCFGDGFWSHLKSLVSEELNKDKTRAMSALGVIKDFEIKSAVPQILDMIYENDDETLICEGLSTLKQFDALSYTDKDEILSNLKNETIKAIVKSYYS